MNVKLRVLVADDDEHCRWAMANLLRPVFDVVATACDGKQLVQYAMSYLPDVIVSDFSMPGLTGAQAMAQLHENGYEIPFVIVGNCNAEADGCLKRGAVAIVGRIDMGHELVSAVFSAACGLICVSRKAEN